jgi:4-hydroxy-2-oxoheptanedioate aldolase
LKGIIIDCEHGHISDDAMHNATAAIAALGVSPLVRIRMTHPDLIKRALDAGAQCVNFNKAQVCSKLMIYPAVS